MPRQEDLVQTRGFPASRTGRFQGRGPHQLPFQLASGRPSPRPPPSPGSPRLPCWSSHLASYFWPRGRRSETRLGGRVWQVPRPVFWGWPHPVGHPPSLPSPAPTPLTTTSPSPRTGQALATPRLHPTGEPERGSAAHCPACPAQPLLPQEAGPVNLRGLHPDPTLLT